VIAFKERGLLLTALIAVIFMLYLFACGKVYLAPPQIIETPDQNHSLASRMFQGIPSLAISPEGRLWATWYAGKTPNEDHNNYVVVATSGDGGMTWTELYISSTIIPVETPERF
jgi:Neuraminidase (sialidase)